MVKLLTTNDISSVVQQVGLEKVMEQMVQYLSEDFKRWSDFDKSPRVATHYDNGVIELMPISDDRTYAFKYVNGHPGNTKDGKQTVVAFGMLANAKNGYPYLISEMTYLTAIRTAAVSALAAKHLARKDSEVLSFIGTGGQSEFQCTALKGLFDINEIRFYDTDEAAMSKFENNMSHYGISMKACDSVEHAISGADIITTATAIKGTQTVLSAQDIESGTHINGVGGDCPGKTELASDLVDICRVFVEYEPQTRIEGEIQQLHSGVQVRELAEVISGKNPGRLSNQDITLFDSVGFALEDLSILRYFYDRSGELNIGQNIELIPEIENPKDIYSDLLKAV